MKIAITSFLFPVLALLAVQPSTAQDEEDHSTLRGLKAPPYTVQLQQDLVNPGVFFGTGNGNGHWVVANSAPNSAGKSVEVALRAKLRYQGDFTQLKPGEYVFDFGQGKKKDGITDTGLPKWNFEFEVDSDVECLVTSNTCTPVATYVYELALDTNPTINTNWVKFDPINAPYKDHSFGKTDTTESNDFVVPPDANALTAYDALIHGGVYHVAQNSLNYGFGDVIGGSFANNGILVNSEGIYDIVLSVKGNKGKLLAKAAIRVLVKDPSKCITRGKCFPTVLSDCTSTNIKKFNMFFTNKQTKECQAFVAGIKQ